MTVSRCTCVEWDVAGRPAGRRLSRRTIYAAYLRPMNMRAHDGREEPRPKLRPKPKPKLQPKLRPVLRLGA